MRKSELCSCRIVIREYCRRPRDHTVVSFILMIFFQVYFEAAVVAETAADAFLTASSTVCRGECLPVTAFGDTAPEVTMHP